MKIEIWSDYACPFCYIGKRRLEDALNKFEDKDNVEIVFKSFELNAQAPDKYDKNIDELIAEKYGISLEESISTNNGIVAQAKDVGLNFDFKNLKPSNTFDGHRITHYAKDQGNMLELSERIFKAYFEEGLLLSDHKVLARLASEVGLDNENVLEILATDRYESEVREDERKASMYGVRGVPYFVFDDKYAVSGAQPPEVFLNVLKRLKSEENSKTEVRSSEKANSGICIDGKCNL